MAKGLKHFETFNKSPFKPTGLVEKVRIKRGDDREVVVGETGEQKTLIELDRHIKVTSDGRSYTKLFHESFGSVGTLSIPGLKLMLYMMLHVTPNRDVIIVNIDSFLSMFGYADEKEGKQRNKVHYYKGAVDLLEHNFVAKKTGVEHAYFINVDVFFNGDRTKLKRNFEDEEFTRPTLQ